ncbi:hypothetical protein QN357_01470 [Cryobacterium sp. RTC2.1]|uniref:hypothetical protein n=1 Tax=Cryobacterium sp. RTC2.1 TaxID=3048634 RepID=UPI002B2371E6|nr:hypothetical protein [Cryobacterium sp. RTC2.1]MEB0001605.1 hypothetical protein [Cryobacterium sp. RTC2.1]
MRKELGYKPDQGDTDELDLYAGGAVERIERKIGKVSGQVIKVTATGPTDLVRLHARASEVTRLTVNGVAVDLAGFELSTGSILRGNFPPGALVVWAVAPLNDSSLVVLAARRLAALWWKQSKNGPHGQADVQDAATVMGVGIPRVVLAMIDGIDDLAGIG